MSTIAILSDIHSNLVAFNAVLKDVIASGARELVFLGDIVGYGSQPGKCVDKVRALGGKCVMGNHDKAMEMCREPGFHFDEPDWKQSDYEAGLMYSAQQLSEEQSRWLAGLPYWMEISGAVVAHASLYEMNFFHYMEDASSARPSLEILARSPLTVAFFGHTHRQEVFPDSGEGLEWLDESRFQIREGMPCVVMAGSVGQNRGENDRRACWTLWDPVTRTVEFRKVEYDRIRAAKEIVDAGLPVGAALRLLTVEEQEEGGLFKA